MDHALWHREPKCRRRPGSKGKGGFNKTGSRPANPENPKYHFLGHRYNQRVQKSKTNKPNIQNTEGWATEQKQLKRRAKRTRREIQKQSRVKQKSTGRQNQKELRQNSRILYKCLKKTPRNQVFTESTEGTRFPYLTETKANTVLGN